jgi:hypothetical protein
MHFDGKCVAASIITLSVIIIGLTKIKAGTTSSAIKTLQQKNAKYDLHRIQRTTGVYCMPPMKVESICMSNGIFPQKRRQSSDGQTTTAALGASRTIKVR